MERTSRRVLLIGWDGADWKHIDPLLEKGQMPHLEKLINAGVMGNVASLTPMLSPILWTSIATGKHADKHGILGFAEPDGSGSRIRPVSSTSRKCKAVWNILSDRGLRAGVVNWFASHPAEEINGFVVTDLFTQPAGPPDKEWPAVPKSVHPEDLLETLCDYRVHPAETTPAQVQPFIPKLADLDHAKDENLRQLRILLAVPGGPSVPRRPTSVGLSSGGWATGGTAAVGRGLNHARSKLVPIRARHRPVTLVVGGLLAVPTIAPDPNRVAAYHAAWQRQPDFQAS